MNAPQQLRLTVPNFQFVPITTTACRQVLPGIKTDFHSSDVVVIAENASI
jgi:hypothetical protein